MTAEKAIEMFEVGSNATDCVIKKDLYKTAIFAIKKQIKKKVKERSFEVASCAACGTSVLDIEKYCPHCGQALDWGDENDG